MVSYVLVISIKHKAEENWKSVASHMRVMEWSTQSNIIEWSYEMTGNGHWVSQYGHVAEIMLYIHKSIPFALGQPVYFVVR